MNPDKPRPIPNEEIDYYMENDLLVFTAAYHLKRGYCCESGCRHCPFGFKKEQNNEESREADN